MEMATSLEPVLFQSWLMNITFHNRLSMGMIQKPLTILGDQLQVITFTLNCECLEMERLIKPGNQGNSLCTLVWIWSAFLLVHLFQKKINKIFIIQK